MDLNLYRVFLAIYDARSVSRAAEAMGMHQSGVSSALKALRSELGDPLFIKTAKSMQPTPMAERLAEPIRAALASLDHALIASRSFFPPEAKDELRILTGDLLEMPILGSVLSIISELTPQATIRSVTRKPHEIESSLERGEIDFAIGHFPELRSRNLFGTSIGKFTFGFFCRIGHPLAGRTLSTEEFCRAMHVMVEAESSIPNVIERWLANQRIARNVVVRTAHFHCVPELIRMSDLIAVLPTNDAGIKLYGDAVDRIIPPFAMPEILVRAYWHRTVQADARHRWWRQTLLTDLRRMGRELAGLTNPGDAMAMLRTHRGQKS